MQIHTDAEADQEETGDEANRGGQTGSREASPAADVSPCDARAVLLLQCSAFTLSQPCASEQSRMPRSSQMQSKRRRKEDDSDRRSGSSDASADVRARQRRRVSPSPPRRRDAPAGGTGGNQRGSDPAPPPRRPPVRSHPASLPSRRRHGVYALGRLNHSTRRLWRRPGRSPLLAPHPSAACRTGPPDRKSVV